MRTNTSRIMTAFSDVPPDASTAVYPTAQDVCAYLTRYAETFDLLPVLRKATRVTGLGRSDRGWTVQTRDARGVDAHEVFAHVIIATGRYHEPLIPPVPGLDSFTGPGGANHAFTYPGPHQYRDRRVLVCGGNISALEIASEIAMAGAARVACSIRRQRYVLPKLLAGVPADHVVFNRFGALAAETMPAQIVARGLQELVLRSSGRPEQHGALAPDKSVLEAGITLSQWFLPLVAEGRIDCRPWVRDVRGQTIRVHR
jgi:cation diffusion facilitator CzcD-associated flavoprotein CzcO